MTQKILLPVPNTLDTDRAKSLLERIRRRVAEGKVNSTADLISEAMAALDSLFSNLTKPNTQAETLHPERDPTQHNDLMNSVHGDLTASFNTARALSTAITSGFNLTASLVANIDGKVRKLASKSQDVQSTSGVFVEEVIVVGDAFADNTKVDVSRIDEQDRCDLTPGMGATLKRVEAYTITDGAKITVEANLDIYEGKLYALEGEAVPEGGSFHFKKTAGTDHEYVEDGASEAERSKLRDSILDGNADSYWQAEHVIALPNPGAAEMTYQSLVESVQGAGIDQLDLEVTLTMRLVEPKIVNMLVLDPLNAGDGAWLEVTDIRTSMDGQVWRQIEGFGDHNYENILTDEANEELTDYEVGMTLAPNKYEYSGKGLWTFPGVTARYIQIALLQRAPVPAPYDVKVFEMQGSTVTTHVGGGSSRTYTSTSVETKKEELSYINTLRMLGGTNVASGLLGVATTTGDETPLRLFQGSPQDVLADVFDPGRFLHKPAPRSNKREFSGWSLKDSWTETRWDKARYAVGIRDLRAFSYKFSPTSECVSKPFNSPKPISKIVLFTDEAVPREFNNAPVLQPWILYWVSFDDGNIWLPISPTAAGVVNKLGGSLIPVTININSGVPEDQQEPTQAYVDVEDPRSVRFKWRMVRPGAGSDRTPVLKGYKLKLFVENGL